jgi:hypothetical protein
MADYESMTDDQLEKLNQQLMQKRADIKAEQLKINKVLDARAADREAEKVYDNMSDAGKAKLKQIISSAGGIESEEKVEVPGTE